MNQISTSATYYTTKSLVLSKQPHTWKDTTSSITLAPNMTWVANKKRLIEALWTRQNHSSLRTSRNVFETQPRCPWYKNQYQQKPTTISRCNLINALENRSNMFTPKGVYRTPAQCQWTPVRAPLRCLKRPCYNCGTMGHYAADCTRYEELSIDYMGEEETPLDYPDEQRSKIDETPNYMDDEDPEMDQISDPTIRSQINLAQIRAQMNALTNEEYSELIRRMGETHPQDFLDAWLDQHWSSEDRHWMYTCPAGSQWACDFTFTRSRKEPKHLPS